MLTFSTEPCGVTSSSSFDAEAVVLKVEVLQVESCDVIEDDLLMGGGGGGFAQLELWETLLWKKARLGLIFLITAAP